MGGPLFPAPAPGLAVTRPPWLGLVVHGMGWGVAVATRWCWPHTDDGGLLAGGLLQPREGCLQLLQQPLPSLKTPQTPNHVIFTVSFILEIRIASLLLWKHLRERRRPHYELR